MRHQRYQGSSFFSSGNIEAAVLLPKVIVCLLGRHLIECSLGNTFAKTAFEAVYRASYTLLTEGPELM
jgi:hypothetical protein